MIIKKIALDDSAYLTAYIADKEENYKRKALLIIPGGAYGRVCFEKEGEPVALSFLNHGFNTFVLNYSVKRAKVFPAQLIEASLAVKHIKENAEEYGICEDEVFALGFSAGGHLAACLGTMWDKKEIYDAVKMPYGYNKPKGIILVYPVVSGVSYYNSGSFKNLLGTDNPTPEALRDVSVELNVKENASNLFIVHGADDTDVPVGHSLSLALKYSEHKIPFEMHIYPEGPHGFALGNKITSKGNEKHEKQGDWVEKAAKWCDDF